MSKRIILLIMLTGLLALNITAQTTKSINLTTPGTLSTLITSFESNNIVTLSVSGNIDARDFVFLRDKMTKLAVLNIGNASIKAYAGSAGTRPDEFFNYPADELPDYAFYNPKLFTYKSTLTSITLPGGLKSIGTLAFYFSWNLSSISIPAGVNDIAEYAFYGCYALSSFTVAPTNTRYASSNGVLHNKALDTLFVCPNAKTGSYTIPNTVKHIAASAFENCYNLTSISLPSNLQSIGTYAFAYCSGISGNLTLPENLKRLESGAFYGAYNLTGTVQIPASLTDIGDFVFFESNAIKSFSVNSANPSYASYSDALFSKQLDSLFICPGGKTGTFNIPASVKLIGSHAFYKCKSLTGVLYIPAATDYIGYYAFMGTDNLTGVQVESGNQWFTSTEGVLYTKNYDRLLSCSVTKSGSFTIREEVKTIDPGAFTNCKQISGSIHLPAALEWIGDYAFYNCTGIDGFTVDPANSYYSAEQGVLLNKDKTYLYMCPLSKSGSYEIPATVNSIGYSAFEGCTLITELHFPESIRSIGAFAFAGCSGNKRVVIPYGIETIANGAFYNNSNLQSFTIGAANPPIVGYYTFELAATPSATLVVPKGRSTNYQQAPYWSNFINVTEASLNTSVQQQQSNQYFISSDRNAILIQGCKAGQRIHIYTADGQKIMEQKANADALRIDFPRRGIFIVRIDNFTKKIILH